jgi:hypothetical protein
MGLALYAKHRLECMDVQVRLCQELVELGVLGFHLAKPLGFRQFRAAKLGAPLIKAALAKAMLAA